MLRTVQATRYVTPLREGGSLPAIVEADDLGLYVLKFRGAGQGPRALVAELIAGEIGRALGLPVPEMVLVEVDAALGRNEPDTEIRELLKASVGLNLALDYLPGSAMFDPAAKETVDADLASEVVWFDAFVTNVDRTPRNPNLLCWHTQALPDRPRRRALLPPQLAGHPGGPGGDRPSRFAPMRDHVLLSWASRARGRRPAPAPAARRDLFQRILAAVPDDWLLPEPGLETPDEKRAAYLTYFERRLAAAPLFVEEAESARATLV